MAKQTDKRKNNGGKREGAGKPRLKRNLQRRRNITIDDELAQKAVAIGNNLSAGIRIALEAYEP